MPPKDHACIQEDRIEEIERDAKKFVPWGLGITLVSSAFGICCLGFMILHGMVVSDRAEAASNLSNAVAERNQRINRLEDSIEASRTENEKQHREMMTILLRIQK